MAQSAAERVKRWQTKSRLKAFYFDDVDERRRALLAQQFSIADGDPQVLAAISDLFYGLPRCVLAPRQVAMADDGFAVTFPRGSTMWEEAIACLALQRRWPDASVVTVHDGGQMSANDWLYPDIEAEIEHLKALGLWNPSPTVIKRPGAK